MRITSTTVTKMPREKVKTRMYFCLGGNLMLVMTGMGSATMTRLVMMFTGAAQMNSVRSGMHRTGSVQTFQAAWTGLHWKMFMNVRTVPVTLIMARVTHEARRRSFCVFLERRR